MCIRDSSWIVLDCVEQGYKVRACVRDLSKPDKVDHLYAMNYMGLKGSVELVEADLFAMGSYDAALEGGVRGLALLGVQSAV